MDAPHMLYRQADAEDCNCGHCQGLFVFSITRNNGFELLHQNETLEGVLSDMAKELRDWGGFYNLNDLRDRQCH